MRSQELRWAQIRVGLFVALTLFVAFAMLAAMGIAGSPLERRAHLHGLFEDVAGVAVGSPVEMGGVVVGEVAAIDLPDLASGRIPVRLSIDREALQRTGPSSLAFTGSHALVGQRYIGLTWRKAEEAALKDGDAIRTGIADTTEGMIEEARRTLSEIRGMVVELRQASGALARAGRALDAQEGSIGLALHDRALYDRLASAAKSADQLVSDAGVGRDLRDAASSLARTTSRLEHGQGVLGRLMNDDDATRRLDHTLANLETVSGRLVEARGTLGALINDPALLGRMDALLGELNSLFADVRRNPQRYIKVQPF